MSINIFVVPTGVGASIGGFGGDATKAARSIAAVSEKLIVNPNVVNAACFINMTENMLYVEGYALDDFCRGRISLVESKKNKVGVIIDRGIPEGMINLHLNTIQAVQSIYDVDVIDTVLTDEPVGVGYYFLASGISCGTIGSPSTLVMAAQDLLNKGAEAIAIVCLFPEDDSGDYAHGQSVDPIAGVESMISHLITSEFMVPSAHAPAFGTMDKTGYREILDPRVAVEYITPTFLPSVLIGLSRAPRYSRGKEGITFKDISTIIYPGNCLGGIPVLAGVQKDKTIIAVNDNKTVLNVSSKDLDVGVVEVRNYDEACRYLARFPILSS